MTWSTTNPPTRPGHYLNFVSKPQPVVLPSANGRVFVPVVAPWGPFKTPVVCDSLAEYIQVFGPSTTDPGYKAVSSCFRGEGLPGYGGAGQVIVYRFGGSAALKATLALAGTGGTALTLSARYEGSRANGFTVTVQTNASNGALQDVSIFEGAILLESYIGVSLATNAAIVAFAAVLNSRSGWVTAVAGAATTVTNVSNSAMTGGNDGTTLIAGDWALTFAAAASQDFAVFAPFDLTDTTIQASLKAWVQDQNNVKGRRLSAVVGGAANELIGPATTRATAMQDENIQTLGVGQYYDSVLAASFSTAQLAPRYAGILAARGKLKQTTYARFAGLAYDVTANSVPSDSDITTAIAGGVLIIGADGHPLSALRIEQGVTTYYQSTDPKKSVSAFGVPKFVMTMQEFERTLKLWAIVNVITPSLAINKDTREYVLTYAQQILDSWVSAGVLAAGATAAISQNPPPADTDNFVNIDYNWTFARTAEQVRGTAYVV